MSDANQNPKKRGLNFTMGKAYGLVGKRDEMEKYKKHLQELTDNLINQHKRVSENHARQIGTIYAELEKLDKVRTKAPDRASDLENNLSAYIAKLQSDLLTKQESLKRAELDFEQKLLATQADLAEMEEGYAYGDALRHVLNSKK